MIEFFWVIFMKEQDAIELLKGMQNPLQDYADMVGAPVFAYGYQYVYQEPEDYAIEEAIVALREKQSRKWVPMSERLPDKNATYYLVTTMRSPRIEMAWYLDGDWFWNNSDSRMGDVIAWMSLPESYKR